MKKKKILVVEDDKFYSSIFQKKLTSEGYQVIIAEDGEKGLALARSEFPDLILLDLVMPVKDGFETLKDLQQDDTLKSIKVIILSNMGQESEVAFVTKYNVAGYIIKANMSIEEMADTVRTVLLQ